MSALLTSLRGLGRDLVDKRLWPVAVLLLAALAAVPVLIGGSGSEAAPAGIVAAAEPGAAGATPPATATAAKTAGTAKTKTAAAKAHAGGTFDDPFFDPRSRSAGKDSTAGGGGAGAGSSATRAVAKSPTGAAAPRGEDKPKSQAPAAAKTPKPAVTAPTTPPPTPTPTPAAAAPAPSYLRTVVRVNATSGGKARALARLTPLGGTTHPAAVFLGVAKAGARYAVFLLGPRATSHGQATCKGETGCRLIGLKAGQTQVVTVRLSTGATRRFSIRVGAIRQVTTSAARARAARANVHPDGRRVVRVIRWHAATGAALRTARYDERAGLLRAASAVVKSASE